MARPPSAATWDAIQTCVHTYVHTHTHAHTHAHTQTHTRIRAHAHTNTPTQYRHARTVRVAETDEMSAALTAPLRLESARTTMRSSVRRAYQGVRLGRCVRACAWAHGSACVCAWRLGEHPQRTVVRVTLPEQYPEEFGQIDCEANSDADVDELSRRGDKRQIRNTRADALEWSRSYSRRNAAMANRRRKADERKVERKTKRSTAKPTKRNLCSERTSARAKESLELSAAVLA